MLLPRTVELFDVAGVPRGVGACWEASTGSGDGVDDPKKSGGTLMKCAMMAARRLLAVVGVAAGLIVALPVDARACDVCAIYTATELLENRSGFRIGVAQQFSRFSTRVPDASGHPEDEGEWLNGSTTQVLFGWDPKPRLGFQLTLPIITRSYRRLEDGVLVDDRIQDGVLVRGSETGIGDLSLISILRPWSRVTPRSVMRVSLLMGLKLPTGDASRLREEEENRERAQQARGIGVAATPRLRSVALADHVPAGSPSGINGHDLALGSGSWDGVFGGSLYVSFDRLFSTTSFQYSLRSEGAYGYRYGNEINWFVGLGGYVLLHHDTTLSLQLVTSGSYQRPDTLDGTPTTDSGDGQSRLWVFVGPGMTFTWGTSVVLDLAGDLPVEHRDIGLIPEYRIRGGLTYRF